MADLDKMDELDVETFLSKLRAADADKKVDLVQDFAERLGQTNELPEITFDALTLAIAPLIRTSSNQLLSVTLNSFLPAYFPSIPAEPSSNPIPLKLAVHQCLPALLERLNDPKERVSAPASTCVALLGKKCYHHEPQGAAQQAKGKEKETLAGFWERNVKETMGGKGKGWRGKVEALKMLLAMREDKSSGLTLKPWLNILVDLLEDSESHVRDQARETVVALLSPASTPPAARSEVKKLLTSKGVRKTIADGILGRIFSTSGTSTPAPDPPGDDASSAGGMRSRPPTPLGDEIPIVHIASARDLEQEWSKMSPHFQGKETEHNWMPREKAVIRIRGMLRGHAYQHYPEAFLAGLKASMVEGLLKTVQSLRTTLAQQSCAAMQELAEYLGSALDPLAEGILAVMVKMAGLTKKIIAERSQRAVTSVITNTTCRPHVYISFISVGMAEKNVQIRQYCTSHLKTFLDSQAGRTKPLIDTTPGTLTSLEDDVKRALADTTPQVRELGRSAFWSFNALWPSRGAEIINKLDGMARKQLEKADPKSAEGSKSRVASLKGAPKRPSVVSQMLAEKRKEIAASRQGTPRTVSSPAALLPRAQPKELSPPKSPTPAPTAKPPLTSPQNTTPQRIQGSPLASRLPRAIGSPPIHSAHTRSPSLGHVPTSPASPPNSSTPGSPSNPRSPLHTYPSGLRSPSSSSANSGSGTHMLKTPVLARAPLPNFHDPPVGSPPGANGHAEPVIIDKKLQAQADEAVSTAQKLLELDLDSKPPPITPARPLQPKINGTASQYRTPATMFTNGHGRPVWEDSPRPESVTPQMLSKLKERSHERSWWLRQQALMDKASPLRKSEPPSTMTIHRSAEGLSAGPSSVAVVDLQKIALFAQDHPVRKLADEDDDVEQLKVWDDGRLFDLIFDGLVNLLTPLTDLPILENALVLLWELIQHQWMLFEGRDISLADALFRLRAHRNHTVLESTNSLISLLIELSDPLFFLSIIRGAYDSFIQQYPVPPGPNGVAADHMPRSSDSHIRNSGELFGLTSFALCILKLPREVVRIEGSRLGPLVMEALNTGPVPTRQAANTLILAIQVVLRDAQATLDLFPQLNEIQKNLLFSLMEKNGVLREAEMDEGLVAGGRVAVEEKIETLLGKSAQQASSAQS